MRRREDGSTEREHLENAARQLEKRGKPPPPGLEGPECPAALDHVWRWFQALHMARGSSGFGPNPIGFPDIDAWVRLTRADPSPAEVQAILAVDRAVLAALAEDKPKKP